MLKKFNIGDSDAIKIPMHTSS